MGSVFSGIGGFVGNAVNGLTGGVSRTNKYNAALPPIQQQQLIDAINQSQGGFNSNAGNQQALAQMLMQQSQGGGPNPAQAMLTQATNQNNQQAAGLIASQKGISPALAARLAAENASNANQQAAGQGALMGAQQQLAAQGGLQSLYGTMGEQQLQNQNILQNAQAAQNHAINDAYLGTNRINAGVEAQNSSQQFDLNKTLLNAAGGAMAGGGASPGGAGPTSGPGAMAGGPMDSAGMDAGGGAAGGAAMAASHGGRVPGSPLVPGDARANDTVRAMLSPGEIVVPRTAAQDPAKAKAFIDHIMSGKSKYSEPKGYGHILQAHRALKEKVDQLEMKVGKGK